MARIVVRILTVALAVIGCGAVAAWLWSATQSVSPAPNAISFVISPDGRFKAAHASWDGGGAISPFCYDKVFVVPEATTVDRVTNAENMVFEGDCASFAPKDGRVSRSPELSWPTAEILAIRFSVAATPSRAAAFRLRGRDASGQVAVEFRAAN